MLQWNHTICSPLTLFFFSCRIPLSSTQDIRTEPKHIVFMSKLLLLFQFCHICRTGSTPEVKAEQCGTAMVIKTICTNSKCRNEFVWSSQPFIPGTKILAGNFLMCMAVLCAGGSFTKVRQMFLHMGLACVSLRTFFRHQQVSDECIVLRTIVCTMLPAYPLANSTKIHTVVLF